MADDLARFLQIRTNLCPSCGGKLVRNELAGESVELLHARPICAEFHRFVALLTERNDDLESGGN